MQVFFEKRQELKPAIWQYDFRPERPIDFVAGQYVAVHLPGVHGDPRGPSRTFTLTSRPVDPLMSFVLKIPEPHSVYKTALMALEPGDMARIDDAMGDLILPKDPQQPLVFVAGGIGMASYASMLRELIAHQEERPVFLFYVLRSARERIFAELTDAYPLSLNMLTIAPNRLTAQQIRDTTPPEAQIYLSGSQRFVEALQQQFEGLGVPRSQIVFDYFDGYSEL